MFEIPRPERERANVTEFEPLEDPQTGKEIGVRDIIEGKVYPFKAGERLSMGRNKEDKQAPQIILANGARISFKQWKEEIYEPSMREDRKPAENVVANKIEDIKRDVNNLNKELLNTITKSCNEEGALFGIDVTLDSDGIEEIKKVLAVAEKIIDKAVEDTKVGEKYQKLEGILDDLKRKGTVIGISSRIYDGGDINDIQLEIKEGVPHITVPKEIYNIYRWEEIVDSARQALPLIKQRGIAANFMGVRLKKLATLLSPFK